MEQPLPLPLRGWKKPKAVPNIEYRIEQPQFHVVRSPPWALLVHERLELKSPKLTVESMRVESLYEVMERVILKKEPPKQRYQETGKRIEDGDYHRQGLGRQLLPSVCKQGTQKEEKPLSRQLLADLPKEHCAMVQHVYETWCSGWKLKLVRMRT